MSLSLSKKRRNRIAQKSIDENGNEEEPGTSKRLRREAILFNQSQSLQHSRFISTERCGKIKRMHLQNFMCHSNLVVDFHDRVNFIVGLNGSGKSAIVAALVLGLGSKARTTNRAGSMKDFIKTDENSAKIEISFSNTGYESYEPEVYGDCITVIRCINRSGASTLTVKSATGRVISKKISDLNRILMYHNIQVDNLIFVLNQDSAREFLKEMEPHKNYVMFWKATQLELINEKLMECKHNHNEHLVHLERAKKNIIRIRNEIKEAKKNLEVVLSLQALEDKIKTLNSERAWLHVNKCEKELQKIVQLIEAIERKKEQFESWSANKSNLESQLKNQLTELEQDLASKKSDYETQISFQVNIRKNINDAAQKYSNISLILESLKKKKVYNEKSILELQSHINQQENTYIGNMKRKNEVSLNEYRTESKEIEDMISTTKRCMKTFFDSREDKKEKEMDLKNQRRDLGINLDRLRARISSIISNAKDRLAPYGNDIIKLVAGIEKLHTTKAFTKKPCGPIGSYISVPNSGYRSIVEEQLGSLVKAFIVNNAKDRQTLESLAKSLCPQLQLVIITMKFRDQVYDVRNGCVKQPPHETRLLMDEIVCSDPNVTNCLIDRIKMERVLLTDNNKIAEQLSSQRENVPVNLLKIIVPKHNLEYYPEPRYRIYSLNPRPTRYIQVDAQEQITTLEREQKKYQRQIENIENELQKLMQTIKENTELINEKRQLLKQQEAKNIELKSKIAAIENIDYPEHVELGILKQEIDSLNSKLPDIVKNINNKMSELDDAEREKEGLERKSTKQKEILLNIEKEIEDLTQKMHKVQQQLQKMGPSYEDCRKTLKTLGAEHSVLLKDKQLKEKQLNEQYDTASKFGERVCTDREEEEVLNEISEVKSRLKQRSTFKETAEELQTIIEDKTALMNSERACYEKAKNTVIMLGSALQKRFQFINELKKHMAMLLQFSFSYILNARNYFGSVHVNHSERTLTLSVIPRDKHLENALSSTRMLSGGERSYSTIAFLVALWACVDHPFYCLDEYDVFTDVVNRDCLIKLLINEGKDRPNRQYTFLTPQDMALQSDEIVKIHRLAPPQ